MFVSVLLALLLTLCSSYKYTCGGKDWNQQSRIYMNTREVLTPTQHGFSVIVDSTEKVAALSILDNGSWKAEELTLFANLVKAGDSVVSLGSETSLEAVLMGKLVGPKGKLVVFEPYSVKYTIMVKNLEINGCSVNSQVYKLAAGGKEETVLLFANKGTGTTRFAPNMINSAGGTEQVETKQIEDMLGDGKVDFLLVKGDILVVQVLASMKDFLKRSPSIVIRLGWANPANPNGDESQVKDIISWLAKEGFRWYRYRHEDACELGTIELLSVEEMLQIQKEDLLLVGKEAKLSIFSQLSLESGKWIGREVRLPNFK